MSDRSDSPDDAPLEHDEAIALLDDWRDGELSAADAARVKAHVESCARCQRVETALGGGLRGAIAGTATGAIAAPQTELLPGVQRKLRLRSRGRFYAGERRVVSPWPLVLASLVVLGALVVAYLLLGQVAAPTAAPTSSSSARPTGSNPPPGP